jgi:hypothetical protein
MAFGLNYDQGFRPMGSGGGYTINTGGSGGGGQSGGWELYLNRLNRTRTTAEGDANRATSRYQTDSTNNYGLWNTELNNASAERIAAGNNAASRYGADRSYQANKYTQDKKQGRFDTAMPYFTSAIGSIGTGGAPAGKQPRIDAAPVYSDDMINQQVNAQAASTDAATAGNVARARQDLAGRGFGGNSPLAAALEANYRASGMATNASNERDTRFNLAKANSDQVFNGQQAQEAQYHNRAQEGISAAQNRNSFWGSILGSMAGMA